MAKTALQCAHCGATFDRENGSINRQRARRGADVPFFCSQRCAGVRRRLEVPKAELRQRKSDYDREYRENNRADLRRKKADYFQRTYDPMKARVERAKNAAHHTDYCRRYYADPNRKAEKVEYDKQRRDAAFNEWGPAHRLLVDLQQMIRTLVPDKYERAKARGYYETDRPITKRKRNA